MKDPYLINASSPKTYKSRYNFDGLTYHIVENLMFFEIVGKKLCWLCRDVVDHLLLSAYKYNKMLQTIMLFHFYIQSLS